jgi:hypothetical protein
MTQLSDARQRREEKRTGDVIRFLHGNGVVINAEQISDTIGKRAARRIRRTSAFREWRGAT